MLIQVINYRIALEATQRELQMHINAVRDGITRGALGEHQTPCACSLHRLLEVLEKDLNPTQCSGEPTCTCRCHSIDPAPCVNCKPQHVLTCEWCKQPAAQCTCEV